MGELIAKAFKWLLENFWHLLLEPLFSFLGFTGFVIIVVIIIIICIYARITEKAMNDKYGSSDKNKKSN